MRSAELVRKDVGVRLREMREQRGLSLAQLRMACGITISKLSRLERGVTEANMHDLSAILAVYARTLAGFMCDLEAQPQPIERAHRKARR